MPKPYRGGCRCGAVRYEINAEPLFAGHCQCRDCQYETGGGHTSLMGFPAEAVEITGDLRAYAVTADSGVEIRRGFCPICGSPITGMPGGEPSIMTIRVGSLDDPGAFQPQFVCYTSRGHAWDVMDPALQGFAALPPEDDATDRPVDQGGLDMTTTACRQPGVCPHLVCDGAADALDFYTNAFGAEEMIRLPGRDGRLMHAAVRINGAVVMLVDENAEHGMLGPKALKGTPVSIHLMVDDVDAWLTRATAAGATVTMPAADMFWGDRFAMIEDPFGHVWSIATHVRDVSEDDLREAALNAVCG